MANAGKKRMSLLAAFLVLAVIPSVSQISGSPSRAILTRGTLAIRGVPHFPSNAIGALYGEYRWDQTNVKVWVVREELFFSGDWKEYPLRSRAGAAIRAYAKIGGPEAVGTQVFVVREDGYWVLLEIPSSEDRPGAFMLALVSRMAYFASHAKSRSDFSFPAVLDIP